MYTTRSLPVRAEVCVKPESAEAESARWARPCRRRRRPRPLDEGASEAPGLRKLGSRLDEHKFVSILV